MPTFLLIGIPIIVGILLFAILSLPDDEPMVEDDLKDAEEKPKKASKTKKKK